MGGVGKNLKGPSKRAFNKNKYNSIIKKQSRLTPELS